MTVYIRRPEHPKADQFGMIERSLLEREYPRNAPNVISDAMDPIKHMGTGQLIDSKAKFRTDTRASGCVEIGNETIKPRQPIKLDRRERREAIGRAIYHLRNGHCP